MYLIFILLIAILFKNNKTFYSIYKISVSIYNERISKNYENIFYCGAGAYPCGSVAGTTGYMCAKQLKRLIDSNWCN